MSANNLQEPSPSRFIYASRDSSTTVVLDCITVAADSYDVDEDDDGITARVCQVQTVTEPVIFSKINWRPTPRSLSPPGPRVVELRDSEYGEGEEEEGTRILREHKAGSLSPLSMPHRSPASHPQHQQPQRTSSQAPETSYPPGLMAYSTTASSACAGDSEDQHPERLALPSGLPVPCPAGVASPASPHGSASSSNSSSTESFCTCEPEPEQSHIISEIQHICLAATQKFIGGYVSEQRKRRRCRQREMAMRREREHAMKRERERAMARERERGKVSHKDKVKKTTSGRTISQGWSSTGPAPPTHPPSRIARKALVYSNTETEGHNDSPSDSDSTLSNPGTTNPRRGTRTPARNGHPLSSRKPSSPFSYTWMSAQMSPIPFHPEPPHLFNPETNSFEHDATHIDDIDMSEQCESDLDLDTTMTSPPSFSSSGDSSLRLALQSHRLPFTPSQAQAQAQPQPQPPFAPAKLLDKNINRICSILWQRCSLLSHPPSTVEQKRNVLQDMALVLDLGAVLLHSLARTDTTTTDEEGPGEEEHSLEEIADAGVLLCEVLDDWDAVDKIETLEGKYWDYFGGVAG